MMEQRRIDSVKRDLEKASRGLLLALKRGCSAAIAHANDEHKLLSAELLRLYTDGMKKRGQV